MCLNAYICFSYYIDIYVERMMTNDSETKFAIVVVVVVIVVIVAVVAVDDAGESI